MKKTAWIAAFLTVLLLLGMSLAGAERTAEPSRTYQDGDSSYELAENVIDLTGAEVSVEENEMVLEAETAAGIETGDIIFSRTPIMGDVAMGYRVTGVETEGDGTARLSVEEADGTDVFSSYHLKTRRQSLTIGDVRAVGDSGTLLQQNLLEEDGSRTITLNIKPSDDISIEAKITLSMLLDAEYDGNGLPTGYALLTKKIRVVSTVRYQNSLLDGEIAKTLLEALDFGKKDDRLLNVTFFSAGFLKVSGSASVSVDFAMLGSCDVTFTQVNGVYIDGVTYRTVEEPMTYTNAEDFSISGSLSIGLDVDISLKALGFGKIVSFGGGMSIGIGVESEDQYDEDVLCYDIPLTYDIHLGLTIRLGVGSEHLGISFVKRELPLFRLHGTMATFHMELRRNERTHGRYADLEFMTECSIPQSEKLTFQFVTGTREKIKDQHTIFGQTLEEPEEPLAANERVRFLGWTLERDGDETFDFSEPVTRETIPEGGTVKLYARWSEPYQKVTMDFGMTGRAPEVSWYLPGSKVDPPVLPVRMDYRFAGYQYTVVNGDGSRDILPWDFGVNTVLSQDLYIECLWTYEEGYNPIQEIAEGAEADEEQYSEALQHYTFDVLLSTGVQAALHPVTDETLSRVTSVIHITGFTGSNRILVIPEFIDGKPVVYVDGTNFSNKEELVGIFFPATALYVTGFNECPHLQFVSFRDDPVSYLNDTHFNGTRRIGPEAFRNCESLELVDFPWMLDTVDRYAFANTGFSEMRMPSSVTTWGKHAFYGCRKLGAVTLPEDFLHPLREMPEGFFGRCENLSVIEGLDSVFCFDTYALLDTGLTSLELRNVQQMADNALSGCRKLKHLRIEYSTQCTQYGSFADMPCLETFEMVNGFGRLNNMPALRTLQVSASEDFPDFGSGITLSDLTALETLELNMTVTGILSVQNCPGLETISVSRFTKESTTPSFALRNLPALKTLELRQAPSAGMALVLDNTGLTQVDLGSFNFPSSVYIRNNGLLENVIIPEGTDMSTLDIRDNPRMLDLHWRSESCFVVPEFWQNLDSLSGAVGVKTLHRLVFPGNPEISQSLTGYDGLFVVACAPGSKAETYFTQARKNFLGYPYQIMDLESDPGAVFVLFDMKGTNVQLIPDGAEAGSGPSVAVWRYRPGEPLVYPGYICQDYGKRIEGWYLETECLNRVTEGTAVTADLILYPKWVEDETDFLWSPDGDGAVVTGYLGEEENLAIPASLDGRAVTGIEKGALSGNGIRKLFLPSGIRNLSAETFDGCTALEAVTIDNESYVSFDGLIYEKNSKGEPDTLIFCPAARTGVLELPETVTGVAPGAARNAKKITEIHFPESLTAIGEKSFLGCSALEAVQFASDVTISGKCFLSAHEIRFTGPVNAQALCEWADEYAQSYNEYEVSFDTPLSGAPLTLRAGSSLSGFVPAPLENCAFMGWALKGTENLLQEMPAADAVLQAVWKALQEGADGVLTRLDPLAGPDAVIGCEWTAIGPGAVSFDLDSLFIPSAVTEIDSGAFTGRIGKILGDRGSAAESFAVAHHISFEEKIHTLTLQTNPGLPMEPVSAVKGAELELPDPVCSWMQFAGWYLDEAGTLPAEMTEMPGQDLTLYARWNAIPGVEMDFTFRIESDDTVTILGYTGSNALPVLPESISGLPVRAIADYAFSGNQTIYRLTVPKGVETIGAGAFCNTAMNAVTFAGTACTLGEGIFSGSGALTSVMLPSGLEAIPERAFQGCESLRSLTLPDTVRTLGAQAFDACSGMDSLNLPSALDTFDADCLGSCEPETVRVAAGSQTLAGNGSLVKTKDGKNLLYVCRGVTELTVDSGTMEIAAQAAAGCRQLTNVTLPSGLQKIGDRAFANCPNLMEIRIPGSVTEIGRSLFGSHTEIAVYVDPENTAAAAALETEYTVIRSAKTVDVTGLTLSAPSVIPLKSTVQLTASIQPDHATDQRVFYLSMDPSIAAVDGDGRVTGLRTGETVILARAPGGLTAEAAVRVTADGDTRIALKVDTPFHTFADGTAWVLPGETYQVIPAETGMETITGMELSLAEETLYLDAYDSHFSLTSEENQSAEVTLQATAHLADGSRAQGSLKVLLAEQAIINMPETVELYEGDTWTCPYGGLVNCAPYREHGWNRLTSSNPAVARTEGDRVIALKPGFTRVRYPYTKGETCILVRPSGCDLEASLPGDFIYVGYPAQIAVSCPDPDVEIRFSSDNAEWISVSETGLLTGTTSTSANITVSAWKNGQELNRRVLSVRCRRAYTWLDLEDVFDKYWGDSETFLIIQPGDDPVNLFRVADRQAYGLEKASVAFNSSDESVLTVDREGNALALKAGTVTVTATFLCDGHTESVQVISDTWNSSGIDLQETSLKVKTGGIARIPLIREKWNDALTVKYVPEDETHFRIDSEGWVTGLSATDSSVSTEVSVVNQNGYTLFSRTVEISVTDENLAEKILSLPSEITLEQNATLTVLTPDMLSPEGSVLGTRDASVLDQTVAKIVYGWESSEDSITLSGVAPGVTWLSISLYNGQEYLCRVTVTETELHAEIGGLEQGLILGDALTLHSKNIRCPHDYTLTWSGSGAVSVTADGALTTTRTGTGRISLKLTDNVTGKSFTANKTVQVGNLLSGFRMPASTVMSRREYAYNWYLILERENEADSLPDLMERTTVDTEGVKVSLEYGDPTENGGEYVAYLDVSGDFRRPQEVILTTHNGPGHAEKTLRLTLQADTASSDSLYIRPFTLVKGQRKNLYELTQDSTGMQMNWSVSDPSVAETDEKGVMTAKKAGETTLTASYDSPGSGSTISASCEVTVTDEQLTELEVDTTSVSMRESGYAEVALSYEPYGAAIAAESSDESIVTVSGIGDSYVSLHGGKAGTAEVRIFGAEGGAEKTITVTVKKSVTSFAWDLQDGAVLSEGEKRAVHTAYAPADVDAEMTWESSNPAVAEISADGVITGVHRGETWITAYCNGSEKKKAYVRVVQSTGRIFAVPAKTTLREGEIVPVQFYDEQGSEVDPSGIHMESSDTGILATAENLAVIGRGSGRATVSVWQTGGTVTEVSFEVFGKMNIFRIPEGTKTIESEAFADNPAVNAVVTGASRIESTAFANCSGLQYVILKDGSAQIDRMAFEGVAEGFFVICPAGSAVAQQAEGYGWKVLPLSGSFTD